MDASLWARGTYGVVRVRVERKVDQPIFTILQEHIGTF